MLKLPLIALCLVAACGDSPSHVDAAAGGDGAIAPDAPSDARSLDAPPTGTATVRVTAEGEPIGGVTVLWSTPTGAILSTATTAGDGTASATIDIGASVSVLGPNTWFVYTALEPGDDLEVELAGPPLGTPTGQIDVVIPPLPANAPRYLARAGNCGAQTGTMGGTIQFQPLTSCLRDDGNLDILVTASDGLGLGAVTFATVPPATDVELPPWTTTLPPLRYEVSNLVAGTMGVTATTGVRSGGRDFDIASKNGMLGGNGTAAVDMSLPGSFGDHLLYQLQLTDNRTAAVIHGFVLGKPGTVEIDASIQPPLMGLPAFSTANDRVDVTFTSTVVAEPGDGTFIRVLWRSRAGSTVVTSMLIPPGITSVTLPELPAELQQRLPDAANPSFVLVQGMIIEAGWIADYRALREHVGLRLSRELPRQLIPATGGVIATSVPR